MFQLSEFSKTAHKNGTLNKRVIWYILSLLIFETNIPYPVTLKVWILRLFGGKVGDGVIIKPNVKIKYPWNLSIASHVWLGEMVWIDNLDMVEIEDNVCISQNCMLETGSHNFKSKGFDLITKPIFIGSGTWLGCRCLVLPGTTIKRGSIFYGGSVIKNGSVANVSLGE